MYTSVLRVILLALFVGYLGGFVKQSQTDSIDERKNNLMA